MGKHVIKYTNAKTGKVEEEIRYDLADEFEVGILNGFDILRRRELRQKGFSNLTDEEKEEWKNLFK